MLLDQNSEGSIQSQITIPATALTGTTHMRISMKWGAAPEPCESFHFGEVRDYFVTIDDGTPPIELGKISDMVAGATPDIVYAIDQGNQALYLISTYKQAIVETVALPDAQPIAMAYSPVNNDLYIVSASTGNVTVYDADSGQISQFAFSDTYTGRDIDISPFDDLLFILSPDFDNSFITVVDLNTNEVILEDTVSGMSIAVDRVSQTIYTADSGLSPSSIFKYVLTDTEVMFVQSIMAGGNGRTINISPDGNRIVLPCGGGNGPGYQIYDYDAEDLNNILGKWNVGYYPQTAVFSPDGTILYGTNGSAYDQYLYVMDANSYQQIRKIEFPNADDYAVITPNSDGTMVVGFSCDYFYERDYKLYFFSNVGH